MAQATIDVLPPPLLDALAEVFTLLTLTPWNPLAIAPELNPDGAVRTVDLADGAMLTYLVLEHERRVDILQVSWIG